MEPPAVERARHTTPADTSADAGVADSATPRRAPAETESAGVRLREGIYLAGDCEGAGNAGRLRDRSNRRRARLMISWRHEYAHLRLQGADALPGVREQRGARGTRVARRLHSMPVDSRARARELEGCSRVSKIRGRVLAHRG